MFLAVDIGGSKTLLAIFSEEGEIVASHKIPTNKDYTGFLSDIKQVITTEFKDHNITYACCAIPGNIDRNKGIALRLGNLDWYNVPIQKDISDLINGVPVIIENDAALGGLSEAVELKDQYHKVLYVAPGTGMGVVFVIGAQLNPDLSDSEAGHMVIKEEDGKPKTWEDLASGRALKQRYGKLASEIEDPKIWEDFAKYFAHGLQPVLAVLLPTVVVIGAGVGVHLEKFIEPLRSELARIENKMVPTPPIMKAKRPEEANIYGCYCLIKQRLH